MNSHRLKKIILAMLSVVVVYIWYGNLKLFTGNDDAHSVSAGQKALKGKQAVDSNIPLTFQEPRINPFESRKTAKWNPPVNQAKTVQKMPVPAPQAPSKIYSLVGLLNSGKNRIATLSQTNGQQELVSRGDSLEGWRASKIRSEYVIFEHKRLRDTLYLATIELQ